MTFIVKIQKSTNDGGRKVLVYNRSRTIQHEQEMTEELQKLFGQRLKLFAKCSLSPKKELLIGDLVKDQGW